MRLLSGETLRQHRRRFKLSTIYFIATVAYFYKLCIVFTGRKCGSIIWHRHESQLTIAWIAMNQISEPSRQSAVHFREANDIMYHLQNTDPIRPVCVFT